MLQIKPCRPYHARAAGRELLKGADGKSVYKIYFVDIIGRKEAKRYEWDRCGRSRADFVSALAATHPEGIGFVIAFPHIIKVFRFSPEAEILLNVRGLWTKDLSTASLERDEGYVEFACLAEALIAADEYRFWAEAATVEAYLELWSRFEEGRIVGHGKLARYWS